PGEGIKPDPGRSLAGRQTAAVKTEANDALERLRRSDVHAGRRSLERLPEARNRRGRPEHGAYAETRCGEQCRDDQPSLGNERVTARPRARVRKVPVVREPRILRVLDRDVPPAQVALRP